MINLRNSLCLTSALLLLSVGTAQAQVAPAPKKSPRTPVSKEVLAGKSAPLPPSHILEGPATILDTERLRVGGHELRLFGVVPPQMGASFGPQARAVLDSLSQGSVTCQIKDRTREGSYLALCHNAAQADFGLELLRRGLAACARGSLHGTPYDTPYQAAEMAAQTQKLGIWSTTLPSAASESSIRDVMAKAESAKVEAEKAKQEAEQAKKEVEQAKAELAKTDRERPASAQQPAAPSPEVTEPATTLNLGTGNNASQATLPTNEEAQALLMSSQLVTATPTTDTRGFMERYQLLISGLLLFGTTLVLSGVFAWNKLRQKKEDMRSIAAALHGELLAARSVCQARLSKIAQEGTDKNTTWPRIRVIVFQAYIGKLGCLGAELSRQIASIYGMASDYASYYNTTEPRSEGTSKRQALEALIQHIEEVAPRLNKIEKEGKLPTTTKPIAFRAALKAPAQQPLSLSSTPTPMPPSGGTKRDQAHSSAPRDFNEGEPAPSRNVRVSMSEAKTEIVSDATSTMPPAKRPQAKTAEARQNTKTQQVKPSVKATAKSHTQRTAQQAEHAAQAAIKAVSGLNLKAPILERLSQLKAFAKDQFDIDKKKHSETLDDFSIPDYANLTEDELEALLYAEEDMILASPTGKYRQAG